MKVGRLIIASIYALGVITPIFGTTYLVANPHIRKILTIQRLKKDTDSLEMVAQLWTDLDYKYMYTNREKYEMDKIDVGNTPNDGINVGVEKKQLAYLLQKKNYRYIMKSDNAVYFTKYASLGNGYGVAFSKNGSAPQNELIITSEKINNFDGWYYYTMR